MRTKIERYTTEPKPVGKAKTRSPSKINHNFRSITTNKIDLNATSSGHSWDDICFKKNDLESKSFMSSDLKKKNFVVNRRKRNWAVSTSLRETNVKNFARGSWIEEVEQESYQGLREHNEDRMIVKECIEINDKEFSVFAVFDGHGGASASEYLKINLLKTLERFSKYGNIPEILKKSIEDLESKILQFGLKIGSGSCATILIIRENEYWSANVGDSRILMIRTREDFIQITDDHKPESNKEIKRIEKLGGKIYRNSTINELTSEKSYGPYRIYPSRLSVSRTLGDFAIKIGQEEKIISSEPDITSGKLQHGDVIILMSDGAYEQFSNNEISILFAFSGKETLRQRLNNFFIACRKRGTNDNVSLVCLQIKQKSKSTEASEAESIKEFSPSKVDAQI